jgi:hypothetical protein
LKFPFKYYKSHPLEKQRYNKRILQILGSRLGLEILFFTDVSKKSFLEDPLVKALINNFSLEELSSSLDRKFVLSQLLKYTVGVDGDYIEFGVYKGASAFLMSVFVEMHKLNKHIHLVDSFEGLSEPDPKIDGTYWKPGDLKASFVSPALSKYDFVKVYKGWIPDVFKHLPSDLRISFAHIDVDLYEPTKESLIFTLYRLSHGGIILFDDYYFETCPGAKKAVDETLGEDNVIILPTGQAFFYNILRGINLKEGDLR